MILLRHSSDMYTWSMGFRVSSHPREFQQLRAQVRLWGWSACIASPSSNFVETASGSRWDGFRRHDGSCSMCIKRSNSAGPTKTHFCSRRCRKMQQLLLIIRDVRDRAYNEFNIEL